MGLNFRYLTSPNLTVGLYFGWHVFYERAFREINLEQEGIPGTLSGSQDRWLNSFPMMLNAHFYLGDRGDMRPYVGVNAGGFLFAQRIGLGVFTAHEDRWDWGIAPEVGIVVPTSRHTGLLLNARYQMAFTGEIFGFDAMHEYYGFGVGFVWDEQ
jgi:outer membrane protein W